MVYLRPPEPEWFERKEQAIARAAQILADSTVDELTIMKAVTIVRRHVQTEEEELE